MHPKNLGSPIYATDEASDFRFGEQFGFSEYLNKNNESGPNLAGVWARRAFQKLHDPCDDDATATEMVIKLHI